ncbi:protein-tyrosine phosphatase-like protein [Mycena amicta]|nr:protein-tyrosine phosphatase-like protein [Mycena amicta]
MTAPPPQPVSASAPALDAYGWPIQELDYDYEQDEMTMLLPGLFLGSEHNARDGPSLRRNRITHILSVMPNPPEVTSPLQGDGEEQEYQPKRLTVPVLDVAEEELFPYFRQTNAFIDEARNNNLDSDSPQSAVLVHCQMGVSRSATVVAAYLMSTNPRTPTPSSALSFLESKRCIVRPNWGFREQLALFHRCGCGIPSDADTDANEDQAKDADTQKQNQKPSKEHREAEIAKWRAGMAKRKRLALDKLRREHERAMRAEWEGGSSESEGSESGSHGNGAWVKNWRRASRWAASVLV